MSAKKLTRALGLNGTRSLPELPHDALGCGPRSKASLGVSNNWSRKEARLDLRRVGNANRWHLRIVAQRLLRAAGSGASGVVERSRSPRARTLSGAG